MVEIQIKKQDYPIPETVKHRIKKIKLDNISGSAELSKQSAETILLLIKKISTNSPLEIINLLENTGKKLINAQPLMAPIFNLVNNIFLQTENLKDASKIRQKIQNYCQQFIQQINTSKEQISRTASYIIKNNSTIITHSYSSTLLNTLTYAKKENKKFLIICTESRPVKEGINLAKKLGEKGLTVKLIVDIAVFSQIPHADLILVGADAVTHSGLVNKIGTKGIALYATQQHTAIYALCSSHKILPYPYKLNLNLLKNPKEIIDPSPKNVTPVNYYFDLTPLNHLDGIITEKGIMETKHSLELLFCPLH